MARESIVGEWKNFVFKMIEPKDHPRILKHLRDCFNYQALYRIGYTKLEEEDNDMDIIFRAALNNGHNLSFYAEDKATGKVAGCRLIVIETREVRPDPLCIKTRVVRGFTKFYNEQKEETNIFERYQVGKYAHLFGLCVDPEFSKQGLATEIYGRAIKLLKALDYTVVLVAFISPYSRAAGMHHGFVEISRRFLIEALDDEGNILYPDTEPGSFRNMGVFELK